MQRWNPPNRVGDSGKLCVSKWRGSAKAKPTSNFGQNLMHHRMGCYFRRLPRKLSGIPACLEEALTPSLSLLHTALTLLSWWELNTGKRNNHLWKTENKISSLNSHMWKVMHENLLHIQSPLLHMVWNRTTWRCAEDKIQTVCTNWSILYITYELISFSSDIIFFWHFLGIKRT